MSVNRIDATLTDDQRDRANAALAALTEALPFLIDLSAKDRADSPKFGDKHRAFVVKARAIAEAHPDLLPGSFNLQEFRTDVSRVGAAPPDTMPSKPFTASPPTPTSPPAVRPTPPPCWPINGD